MAVRYRHDRRIWIADIDSAHGRYSRHFKTEQAAIQYEMLVNKPCLARLHSICSLLDWHGKDPGQKDRVLNVIKRLESTYTRVRYQCRSWMNTLLNARQKARQQHDQS